MTGLVLMDTTISIKNWVIILHRGDNVMPRYDLSVEESVKFFEPGFLKRKAEELQNIPLQTQISRVRFYFWKI